MSSRNVETLRTAHQAFNRRDFATVANLMTEDVTYDDKARNTTFRGRDGFIRFMQGWATAFSTAAVTDPVYTDAGDMVIAEFIGTGVNDGPLGALPATGKPVTFPMCEILHFNSEGKMTSGCAYYDQLSILTQLGHVPGAPMATSA